MRITILSPHRDDAAFSCGLTLVALLRAGAKVTVLNVFTRSDYAVQWDTIDSTLPLVDAVSRARRLEDERFVADLASAAGRESASVCLYDLQQLDAPLRLAVLTERVLEAPLTDEEVRHQAKQLAAQLSPLQQADVVFAPLALGDHIDHRIVREAAKLAAPADRLCQYEDLPYAARLSSKQRKEQTVLAIPSNGAAECVGYTLRLQHGPHLKSRFAMHYSSQIAPEVAKEMAQYAAQGCIGSAGAEHWWAMPATSLRIATLLRDAAVEGTFIEEQR